MEDWNDWATTNEFFCHPMRLTRPLFAFQIIPILSFFVRDVYSWCKERELSRIATTIMQSKRSIVTIERQHIIILWKHTRMSTTSNPEESRMVEKKAYRETQKGFLRFSCWLLEAQPSQTWYDEGNAEACMPGIIRKHIVNDNLWNDTRLVSLFYWLNLLKLAKNGDMTDQSSSSRPTESIDMTATMGFMGSNDQAMLIPFLLEMEIERKLLMQWPHKRCRGIGLWTYPATMTTTMTDTRCNGDDG